ncbi:hypothetical protein [Desulforamulus ferrireducens]|uniref:hypothetical protein n=1 Tax=Desulforamulus ferrireducens TaxID=1833852 RepID=UPI0011EA5396|nr:hypothetical protein [Desulforamulus ferrireducens]
MHQLVQLRHEIAKMRLMDLARAHGQDSPRVNNYRKRMGEMLADTTNTSSTLVNKAAAHKKVGY